MGAGTIFLLLLVVIVIGAVAFFVYGGGTAFFAKKTTERKAADRHGSDPDARPEHLEVEDDANARFVGTDRDS